MRALFLLLYATAAAATPAADANNAFAVDLFRQLTPDETSNLVYSPASVDFALAMTYGGARGETATEMANALHYQGDPSAGLGALMAQLNGEGRKPGLELRVVNRIWAQKGFPWSKPFLATAEKAWAAGIEQADFVNAAAQAQKTINDWVEKQTHSRIKNLIPDGILDSSTVMVLVNAIYFKGSWLHKFDKRATRDESFTTAAGKKVETPLMHQTATLRYAAAPGLQVVELPYRGSTLAMDVVVPNGAGGLPSVEKQLANLPSWLERLQPVDDLELTLPRFEVTVTLALAPALKALGMKQAFIPGTADFTGMVDAKKPLSISAVLHKAFVRVDEEGAEAAAATAVLISATDAHIQPKVRADHPFLWLIRDTKSGAILFVGRVTDPTAR
jgi:serpin B